MELLDKFPRSQGFTITIGNSKGGVSKTTSTALLAYNFAKKGIKTLVLDADKQGNLSKTLLLTREVEKGIPSDTFSNSFMDGVKGGDMSPCIISVMDNLDLIPSDEDTRNFSRYLYQEVQYPEDRDFLVHDALEKIKFNYDIVLIDSPPNNYEIMRNVTLASDYVVVAFQPHEHSLTGAETYIQDLNDLNNEYDLNLFILGFLPVLIQRGARIDGYIIQEAKSQFQSENVFDAQVYIMQRVKQFDVNGITNNDHHDQFVHDKYNEVALEFLDRLIGLEENKAKGGN